METVNRVELEEARRLLGECMLFRGLRAEERNSLVARALFAAVRASFVPEVLPIELENVYCEFSVSPLLKRRPRDICSAL